MVRLTAPWLSLPTLQYLFELFEQEGAILRLVGGSVRDGLLGLPVSDIDLAVDRDPHWVTDLLEKNHIKVIPTGIDHGTITAILEKRPYQITTLRVDIKTFGRKAQVAFTEDWVQDALRRDFTINALTPIKADIYLILQVVLKILKSATFDLLATLLYAFKKIIYAFYVFSAFPLALAANLLTRTGSKLAKNTLLILRILLANE